MGTPGRTLLTWLGRVLLLAVPLILLAGLYYPRAIAPLEPLLCRQNTSFTNVVKDPDTPFDNRAICESDTLLVDVTDRLVVVAAGSFLLAVSLYLLRSRITPRAFSAPRPSH